MKDAAVRVGFPVRIESSVKDEGPGEERKNGNRHKE